MVVAVETGSLEVTAEQPDEASGAAHLDPASPGPLEEPCLFFFFWLVSEFEEFRVMLIGSTEMTVLLANSRNPKTIKMGAHTVGVVILRLKNWSNNRLDDRRLINSLRDARVVEFLCRSRGRSVSHRTLSTAAKRCHEGGCIINVAALSHLFPSF